jgi:hypothetical protein
MNRIYHTWDCWECYPAGFYENQPANSDATKDELEKQYAEFLGNDERFRFAIRRLIAEWPKSCEHYLSNENMNRIAWIGQSAACLAMGIPSAFRGGFHLLTEAQQTQANQIALEGLNVWLGLRDEPPITLDDAQSKTEMNLY